MAAVSMETDKMSQHEIDVREIKKYQWDIQGKGKSTITDKLRRTTRTRQSCKRSVFSE